MRVLNAEYVTAATGPAGFPKEGLPEIAFAGRSNVGKSSLINLLVGRKSLAHSSSTPGKTRLIQFFELQVEHKGEKWPLLFADLPGFGYAKVSKGERKSWRRMVESYLDGREPLRAVVLLQDIRRDVRDEEKDLLAWLCEHGIPVFIALTKVDKLKSSQRQQRIQALTREFDFPKEQILPTSATKRDGAEAFWRALETLLN